jgi:hypothetical protein
LQSDDVRNRSSDCLCNISECRIVLFRGAFGLLADQDILTVSGGMRLEKLAAEAFNSRC